MLTILSFRRPPLFSWRRWRKQTYDSIPVVILSKRTKPHYASWSNMYFSLIDFMFVNSNKVTNGMNKFRNYWIILDILNTMHSTIKVNWRSQSLLMSLLCRCSSIWVSYVLNSEKINLYSSNWSTNYTVL